MISRALTGAVLMAWSIATANRGSERAADLIQRNFTADQPNRVWVADFTHVAAWRSVVHAACPRRVRGRLFSRAIVDWAAATTKHTTLILNALDIALWRRERLGQVVRPCLAHHADAGPPNTPVSAHLYRTATTRLCGERQHCQRARPT